MSSFHIGEVPCGGDSELLLIAGPCQVEGLDHAMMCAEALSGMAAAVGMGFVYKSSYDKANRTSAGAARAPRPGSRWSPRRPWRAAGATACTARCADTAAGTRQQRQLTARVRYCGIGVRAARRLTLAAARAARARRSRAAAR